MRNWGGGSEIGGPPISVILGLGGVGPPTPEVFVRINSDRISKISVYDGCKLYYFFS